MTIAYAAIDGGRDYAHDALVQRGRRVEILGDVARAVAASQRDLTLLAFPAGYLGIRSRRELDELDDRVDEQLSDLKPAFGILWGVDMRGSKKPKKKGETVERDEVGYPLWVSYRSPAGEITRYQQISITAEEGRGDDITARWGKRAVLLPGTKIALLICGECWSAELLDRVGEAKGRALVIAAHRNVNLRRDAVGMGKMSWHRQLSRFRHRSGIPVVLSEHTRSPDRHRRAWPSSLSRSLPLSGLPPEVTLNVTAT